jgi:hypothetical protein
MVGQRGKYPFTISVPGLCIGEESGMKKINKKMKRRRKWKRR